jgi:pimeloyl-ACP methyl ester carboxylesterase
MSDFEPRVLQIHEMGEGEPLVLLPGGLTGWESWVRHQADLASKRRVIRVQPIHNERGSAGESGVPGYSLEVECESLRMTLDELGIDVADFAGWSSGGRALVEFAIVHPERIRSLTLVEPAAGSVLAAAGVSDPELEELNEFLFARFGREFTEDDLARFVTGAGFVADPAEARSHPSWENWVGHRMALAWVPPEAMGSRSLAELASITAPTLLVRGSPEDFWLGRVVSILAEHLPHAELLELEGGHAPHLVSYDDFMSAFDAHLDREAASTGA